LKKAAKTTTAFTGCHHPQDRYCFHCKLSYWLH